MKTIPRENHRLAGVLMSLLVLVTVVPAPLAAQLAVERVRHSTEGARTRLVLDVSGRCDYQVVAHKNPDRIAVNIRRAGVGRDLVPVEPDRGVVSKVRINRLSWGTQVVLDLKNPALWSHFALGRTEERSDRIVLDVFDPPGRAASAPGNGAGVQAALGRSPSLSPPGSRLLVVAVDAGHGGKDPGTKGRYGLVEKKLVLDMAQRTVAEINKRKGFKAVLTRSTDRYLSLTERTEIARQKGADVFVSIHLNSAPNRAARGAEVFFLSPAGAAATTSRVLSNPNRAKHDLGLTGTDNADLLHMLVDVNQQAVLQRSELLAESIIRELSRQDLPPTRSVKQKSFSVLRITMPSVLVEAGFLTNANDAKLLRSTSGRDRIATSIAAGVVSFLGKHPPSRSAQQPVVVHKVEQGENLWRISQKYGTSVASLRRANKLSRSDVIRVGQELLISSGY